MKKWSLWIGVLIIIGCGNSSSQEKSFNCIGFTNNELKINFCKKHAHPYFAEYERYLELENISNGEKKKHKLRMNTGGKTFINFYIDERYEFKEEVFDVLVLIDKDLCMAFKTSNLEYIGQDYFHRRTEQLKYIGSIRHNTFYTPNEKSEEIIESRFSDFTKVGVAYRAENEHRATDLIFQVSPKLPIDTSQNFNNVGFVIMDEERENYYVVDVSEKIDTIPLKEWKKNGINEDYQLSRFKEPIWQFEYDLICYEVFKLLGDEIDKDRNWNNDKYYNSEIIWKLLKKYKGIEISEIEGAENKKVVSVQSILNSNFLEIVEKK